MSQVKPLGNAFCFYANSFFCFSKQTWLSHMSENHPYEESALVLFIPYFDKIISKRHSVCKTHLGFINRVDYMFSQANCSNYLINPKIVEIIYFLETMLARHL